MLTERLLIYQTVEHALGEQIEYGYNLSFNVPSQSTYFEGFEESEDEEDVSEVLKSAGIETDPYFVEGVPKSTQSTDKSFDREWLLR